jgi:O-antigen/teichoic acid export membrane protein
LAAPIFRQAFGAATVVRRCRPVRGGVLVLLAPWIARLLGAGFEATTRLVMLLALLPALQLVRNLLNAVVAQQRRQSVLTAIYLAGGVAGVLLNLWLVPAGGLHGAVAAAYLTEAVLFVLLGAVVLPKSKRLHNV